MNLLSLPRQQIADVRIRSRLACKAPKTRHLDAQGWSWLVHASSTAIRDDQLLPRLTLPIIEVVAPSPHRGIQDSGPASSDPTGRGSQTGQATDSTNRYLSRTSTLRSDGASSDGAGVRGAFPSLQAPVPPSPAVAAQNPTAVPAKSTLQGGIGWINVTPPASLSPSSSRKVDDETEDDWVHVNGHELAEFCVDGKEEGWFAYWI